MVKHIIIWKLKESLSQEEKAAVAQNIKKELEGLKGVIPGLLEMNIIIDKLPSSTGDLMMDSCFEDQDALKSYQSHPEHQRVANTFVRPNVETRSCLDYFI